MTSLTTAAPSSYNGHKKLFWACFVALVATSFVFGLRANIIGDWQGEFDLSEAKAVAIEGLELGELERRAEDRYGDRGATPCVDRDGARELQAHEQLAPMTADQREVER